MIRSFLHKGIEKFFLAGSKAGIQPSHAAKLSEFLGVLNIASKSEQMNVPGRQWHALTADLPDHWSALHLAEALHTEADFWLRLQMQRDLWEASQKKRTNVKPLLGGNAA